MADVRLATAPPAASVKSAGGVVFCAHACARRRRSAPSVDGIARKGSSSSPAAPAPTSSSSSSSASSAHAGETPPAYTTVDAMLPPAYSTFDPSAPATALLSDKS